MKTRVIKQANKFFPQYYNVRKLLYMDFSSWKYYMLCDSSVDVLGGYSEWEEKISFDTECEAVTFIKKDQGVDKVIVTWQSDDEIQKRPIVNEDVPLCDICIIDTDMSSYHMGEDFYRECIKCGHKVNVQWERK